MDKQKKKNKIFINKNAGDVTKGVEMFNKSMTFNTQSSAQEELNQRVANNDISSEETYDILNHISELRDEAEKEDDHNNPIGAIKLHKGADKLQETKTKKTTIRECLNKMDLQASDDGFRGITLVDLYEACTLTKDDKNHLIKMLQTTDDAEKVREFLSNKCEFEDIPEDDIDAEVQLECTKSDWEELNDLDEGYQQGDEQVLDQDSEEYKKFEKIADLLNEANIIYTSGRHKGERAYFYVDDVYLDFGSDWKWTTIVREDNVQVLSPADWLSIINEESAPEEIVNKIVTKDYSGVQFANESQLGETITAISLEDAEDQLNSDGHVEYWDYLPDFNYDIEESYSGEESINESNNAVYDMYKKQYKNLLQDIKYVLNSDNIEDIRAYDKEGQGEYILSKLFDSRMNKRNMSFEDAKEDVIDFLYRTRADAKSELELRNKRSLESKSIMNKVKSELSKDYKLVSESENTLYFKAPDNSTHDDCIAFVDKVVAVSGGKYTYTGRGGSWTQWDILTPEGSYIKAGYDYSNEDNYAVYFKSILTESRSTKSTSKESVKDTLEVVDKSLKESLNLNEASYGEAFDDERSIEEIDGVRYAYDYLTQKDLVEVKDIVLKLLRKEFPNSTFEVYSITLTYDELSMGVLKDDVDFNRGISIELNRFDYSDNLNKVLNKYAPQLAHELIDEMESESLKESEEVDEDDIASAGFFPNPGGTPEYAKYKYDRRHGDKDIFKSKDYAIKNKNKDLETESVDPSDLLELKESGNPFKSHHICKGCEKPLDQCTCEVDDEDKVNEDLTKSESLKAKNQNEAKEILYVIKDSHGNQLSNPNADDSELWDRVASMEARGRRGLRVVVYTGKKESLAKDKGQPRSNRYTTYFNRIKRAIEKGDEETLKRTKEAIMYAPAKELKNSEASELMNMIKNRKITESASTNYGGAYDIADDQYFTREELNEFGEDVVDNLNSLAYSKAELESIFIENNIIEITVTWDGNEITVEQPIDMRRIRKPKDLDKYRVRVISKMKPELEELGFDFGPHLGDYELSESFDTELRDKLVQMWFEENTADWLVKNDPATAEWLAYGGATTNDFAEVEQEVLAKLNGEEDHEEAKWKRLLTKSVNDSDGFLTDYSMWYNDGEKRWVFIFGDSDIYDPTNTDPDWETENPEEAREWFLDYKGFEDDEDLDLDENKTMNEAREYYILPVENLIGSERRELGYYDLEMIGRKGLVTYIEGTYPDLSDYARNVLDFDLEEDDPMLTLSSEWDEELDEDVVKQGTKWVNKGKEGTHGTFKTKKDALKQTRAMYAKGYKG